MKLPKILKILTYRFNVQDSLKKLEKDVYFPYRFRWVSSGKKVKSVDVVCDKTKALWIDISYLED